VSHHKPDAEKTINHGSDCVLQRWQNYPNIALLYKARNGIRSLILKVLTWPLQFDKEYNEKPKKAFITIHDNACLPA
jgi:hypothetical protein